MKEEKRSYSFFFTAFMELSWINAWANYLWLSFLDRPSPFLEIIFNFFFAWVLTRFSKDKGWRVINILGLHLLGLALVSLRFVYVFEYSQHSFLSINWIIEFFTTSRNALEWISLFFVLFWPCFLWIRGITLANASLTYLKVTSRFDLGLSAFFVLFLIKLLVWVKGGIRIEEQVSLSMLFSFFVFGLLTITMARNQSEEKKNFLPQFQNMGMVLSFALVVIGLGTGLILFFKPYLNMAAEVTYSGIKIIAQPFGYIFLTILQFMFLRGINRLEEMSIQEKEGLHNPPVPASEQSWWVELLEKVVSWGLLGLLILIAIIASGVMIFYLFRFLFSKTSYIPKKRNPWTFDLTGIYKLKAFLLYIWSKILFYRGKQKNANQFFINLLKWGNWSGLYYFINETPLEYGDRLKERFPILGKEITAIIEAFNQESYGNMILSENQISGLTSALKRLRSPKHWPSRMKNWLIRPDVKGNIVSRYKNH